MANAQINVDVNAKLSNGQALEKEVRKIASKPVPIAVEYNTKSTGSRSSRPLGTISGEIAEIDKSLGAANARVIAFGASAGAVYALDSAVRSLFGSFINTEKKLTDINVLLNLSASSLAKFGGSLFDIAGSTGQAFNTVAEAATELSRQGLSVEETLKRTEAALVLTRLSGMGAAESVSTLTAAMNSFSSAGLEANEIVNKMANVDAAFAVSSGDLAQAVSRVGSSASEAGVSFDELIALVTTAQQVTARGGNVIGNSLKTIFTRMNRGKTEQLVSNLGISIEDDSGAKKNQVQLLKELAGVYETLGATQKNYVAEQIGGVFQINVLKAALGDLGKEYSIYDQALKTSITSTDEATQRNEKLNQTISARANKVVAGAGKASASIGEGLFGKATKRVLSAAEMGLGAVNDSDSQSVGAKIGSGLVNGLGNFLAGPGLGLIALAGGKLLLSFAKTGSEAASGIMGTNKAAKDQASIQENIAGFLKQSEGLYGGIEAGQISVTAAAETYLGVIRKQTKDLENQKTIAAEISKYLGSRVSIQEVGGVKMAVSKAKTAASGYVPAIAAESANIASGIGGAMGGDRPVNIPNFNFGGGKSGPIVAHTGEWIVPNYAGSGGSAIFNRDMASSMGLPAGAQRIAASGYIPSFASGRKGVPVKEYSSPLKTSVKHDLAPLFNLEGNIGDTIDVPQIQKVALPKTYEAYQHEAANITYDAVMMHLHGKELGDINRMVGSNANGKKFTNKEVLDKTASMLTGSKYKMKKGDLHNADAKAQVVNTWMKDSTGPEKNAINFIVGGVGETDFENHTINSGKEIKRLGDHQGIDYKVRENGGKDGVLNEVKVTKEIASDTEVVSKALKYAGLEARGSFKNRKNDREDINKLVGPQLVLNYAAHAQAGEAISFDGKIVKSAAGGYIPNYVSPLDNDPTLYDDPNIMRYFKRDVPVGGSMRELRAAAKAPLMARYLAMGKTDVGNLSENTLNEISKHGESVKNAGKDPSQVKDATQRANDARREEQMKLVQAASFHAEMPQYGYVSPSLPQNSMVSLPEIPMSSFYSDLHRSAGVSGEGANSTRSTFGLTVSGGGLNEANFSKLVQEDLSPGINKLSSRFGRSNGVHGDLKLGTNLQPLLDGVIFEAVRNNITGSSSGGGDDFDLNPPNAADKELFGQNLGRFADLKGSISAISTEKYYRKVVKQDPSLKKRLETMAALVPAMKPAKNAAGGYIPNMSAAPVGSRADQQQAFFLNKTGINPNDPQKREKLERKFSTKSGLKKAFKLADDFRKIYPNEQGDLFSAKSINSTGYIPPKAPREIPQRNATSFTNAPTTERDVMLNAMHNHPAFEGIDAFYNIAERTVDLSISEAGRRMSNLSVKYDMSADRDPQTGAASPPSAKIQFMQSGTKGHAYRLAQAVAASLHVAKDQMGMDKARILSPEIIPQRERIHDLFREKDEVDPKTGKTLKGLLHATDEEKLYHIVPQLRYRKNADIYGETSGHISGFPVKGTKENRFPSRPSKSFSSLSEIPSILTQNGGIDWDRMRHDFSVNARGISIGNLKTDVLSGGYVPNNAYKIPRYVKSQFQTAPKEERNAILSTFARQSDSVKGMDVSHSLDYYHIQDGWAKNVSAPSEISTLGLEFKKNAEGQTKSASMSYLIPGQNKSRADLIDITSQIVSNMQKQTGRKIPLKSTFEMPRKPEIQSFLQGQGGEDDFSKLQHLFPNLSHFSDTKKFGNTKGLLSYPSTGERGKEYIPFNSFDELRGLLAEKKNIDWNSVRKQMASSYGDIAMSGLETEVLTRANPTRPTAIAPIAPIAPTAPIPSGRSNAYVPAPAISANLAERLDSLVRVGRGAISSPAPNSVGQYVPEPVQVKKIAEEIKSQKIKKAKKISQKTKDAFVTAPAAVRKAALTAIATREELSGVDIAFNKSDDQLEFSIPSPLGYRRSYLNMSAHMKGDLDKRGKAYGEHSADIHFMSGTVRGDAHRLSVAAAATLHVLQNQRGIDMPMMSSVLLPQKGRMEDLFREKHELDPKTGQILKKGLLNASDYEKFIHIYPQLRYRDGKQFGDTSGHAAYLQKPEPTETESRKEYVTFSSLEELKNKMSSGPGLDWEGIREKMNKGGYPTSVSSLVNRIKPHSSGYVPNLAFSDYTLKRVERDEIAGRPYGNHHIIHKPTGEVAGQIGLMFKEGKLGIDNMSVNDSHKGNGAGFAAFNYAMRAAKKTKSRSLVSDGLVPQGDTTSMAKKFPQLRWRDNSNWKTDFITEDNVGNELDRSDLKNVLGMDPKSIIGVGNLETKWKKGKANGYIPNLAIEREKLTAIINHPTSNKNEVRNAIEKRARLDAKSNQVNDISSLDFRHSREFKGVANAAREMWGTPEAKLLDQLRGSISAEFGTGEYYRELHGKISKNPSLIREIKKVVPDFSNGYVPNMSGILSSFVTQSIAHALITKRNAMEDKAFTPSNLRGMDHLREIAKKANRSDIFEITSAALRSGLSEADAKAILSDKGGKAIDLNSGSYSQFFPSKSEGYIPSFNKDIKASIGREIKALTNLGYSQNEAKNSIQVHTGISNVSGSQNPMGAMVTNTLQEPNGVSDAFDAHRGENLKTVGKSGGYIPNYAEGDDQGSAVGGMLAGGLSSLMFALMMNQNGGSNDEEKRKTKKFNDKLAEARKNLINAKNKTNINSSWDSSNLRFNTGYALSSSKLQAKEIFSNIGQSIPNIGGSFAPKIRPINKASLVQQSWDEGEANGLYKKQGTITLEDIRSKDPVMKDLTSVSRKEMADDLRARKANIIANDPQEVYNRAHKNASFQSSKNISSGLKANALGYGMAAQAAAGVVTQISGGEGTKTGSIAAGVGNMASMAATGFMLGGPLGAGIGVVVGALTSIPAVISAFNDGVKKAAQKAAKSGEEFTKLQNGTQTFLMAKEKVSDLGENGSRDQKQRANDAYYKALAELPVELQKQMQSSKTLSEAQEILAKALEKKGIEASATATIAKFEERSSGSGFGRAIMGDYWTNAFTGYEQGSTKSREVSGGIGALVESNINGKTSGERTNQSIMAVNNFASIKDVYSKEEYLDAMRKNFELDGELSEIEMDSLAAVDKLLNTKEKVKDAVEEGQKRAEKVRERNINASVDEAKKKDQTSKMSPEDREMIEHPLSVASTYIRENKSRSGEIGRDISSASFNNGLNNSVSGFLSTLGGGTENTLRGSIKSSDRNALTSLPLELAKTSHEVMTTGTEALYHNLETAFGKIGSGSGNEKLNDIKPLMQLMMPGGVLSPDRTRGGIDIEAFKKELGDRNISTLNTKGGSSADIFVNQAKDINADLEDKLKTVSININERSISEHADALKNAISSSMSEWSQGGAAGSAFSKGGRKLGIMNEAVGGLGKLGITIDDSQFRDATRATEKKIQTASRRSGINISGEDAHASAVYQNAAKYGVEMTVGDVERTGGKPAGYVKELKSFVGMQNEAFAKSGNPELAIKDLDKKTVSQVKDEMALRTNQTTQNFQNKNVSLLEQIVQNTGKSVNVIGENANSNTPQNLTYPAEQATGALSIPAVTQADNSTLTPPINQKNALFEKAKEDYKIALDKYNKLTLPDYEFKNKRFDANRPSMFTKTGGDDEDHYTIDNSWLRSGKKMTRPEKPLPPIAPKESDYQPYAPIDLTKKAGLLTPLGVMQRNNNYGINPPTKMPAIISPISNAVKSYEGALPFFDNADKSAKNLYGMKSVRREDAEKEQEKYSKDKIDYNKKLEAYNLDKNSPSQYKMGPRRIVDERRKKNLTPLTPFTQDNPSNIKGTTSYEIQQEKRNNLSKPLASNIIFEDFKSRLPYKFGTNKDNGSTPYVKGTNIDLKNYPLNDLQRSEQAAAQKIKEEKGKANRDSYTADGGRTLPDGTHWTQDQMVDMEATRNAEIRRRKDLLPQGSKEKISSVGLPVSPTAPLDVIMNQLHPGQQASQQTGRTLGQAYREDFQNRRDAGQLRQNETYDTAKGNNGTLEKQNIVTNGKVQNSTSRQNDPRNTQQSGQPTPQQQQAKQQSQQQQAKQGSQASNISISVPITVNNAAGSGKESVIAEVQAAMAKVTAEVMSKISAVESKVLALKSNVGINSATAKSDQLGNKSNPD